MDYVEHDFVKLLGNGTLPRSAFVHFIKQVLVSMFGVRDSL